MLQGEKDTACQHVDVELDIEDSEYMVQEKFEFKTL